MIDPASRGIQAALDQVNAVLARDGGTLTLVERQGSTLRVRSIERRRQNMVASAAGKDGVYAVVSPLGEPVTERITMAPRLKTLEGKTICEIWNGGFRGDESFPMIERMLREKYPTVRMIPYPEFPLVTIASLHPERKKETLEALRVKIKEKGCDAVITGNGC